MVQPIIQDFQKSRGHIPGYFYDPIPIKEKKIITATFDTETIALPSDITKNYNQLLYNALSMLNNVFDLLSNIEYTQSNNMHDIDIRELLCSFPDIDVDKSAKDINEEFPLVDSEKMSEEELLNVIIESEEVKPNKQRKVEEKLLVCAAGFYNPEFGYYQFKIKKFISYENTLACSLLIIYCINKLALYMSKAFQKKVYCYAHNGGKFDFIFILNMILYINEDNAGLVVRNGRIMQIKIEYEDASVYYRDSLNLLASKLSDLAKQFLGEEKTDIMSRKYYVKEFYAKLIDENFNLDFDKYLQNDCIFLYKILDKFNSSLIEKIDISIHDALTISSISKKLYFNKFNSSPQWITNYSYKDIELELNQKCSLKEKNKENKLKIPIVNLLNSGNFIYPNSYEIDLKIRQAFKGGRVEVFIPANFDQREILVYDVNSLYPYAAANYPMPFGPARNIKFDKPIRLTNGYGTTSFINATILYEPTDEYAVPILCIKQKDDNIYPFGYFTGWFYSSEISCAIEAGYKVLVHEVIFYTPNFFHIRNFMNTLYDERQKYTKLSADPNLTPDQRDLNKNFSMIYKLLMNGFYGIMGISAELNKFEICSSEYAEAKKQQYPKIQEINRINNKVLLSYDTLYKNVNVDQEDEKALSEEDQQTLIIKKYSKNYDQNLKVLKSAAHISAAITAEARVYMYKSFLQNRAYKTVLYTDTDSVMIYKDSDDIPNKYKNATVLGKLKKEKDFILFYAIAKKVWMGIEFKNNIYSLTLKFRGFTKQLLFNFFNIPSVTPDLTKYTEILNFFRQALNLDIKTIFTMPVSDRIKKSLKDLEMFYFSTTVSFDYDNISRSCQKIGEDNTWKRCKPFYVVNNEIFMDEDKELYESKVKSLREEFDSIYNTLTPQSLLVVYNEEINAKELAKINERIDYLYKEIDFLEDLVNCDENNRNIDSYNLQINKYKKELNSILRKREQGDSEEDGAS